MRKILRHWRLIAGQQTFSEWMLKLLDINGKGPLHLKPGHWCDAVLSLVNTLGYKSGLETIWPQESALIKNHHPWVSFSGSEYYSCDP